MRCSLCSNTENILVNLVSNSGLILVFCPACEDTPALEAAARLAMENEKLEAMIEKMRCCMNCKHDINFNHDSYWCECEGCLIGRTKWDLAI